MLTTVKITDESILHIANRLGNYMKFDTLTTDQTIKFIDSFGDSVSHTLIRESTPFFVYCGSRQQWCVELSEKDKIIVCQYFDWKNETSTQLPA